ncbi:2-polyprenyl-6-methoxyphenol hydroxylase-like FAD-dependent oxidoreductase [Pseudarthrobacter defluvii]|uniref:FAD-dependent oxidoreductase n=1 Tax=Pseudarthrobacter defluvii TaxID=410837 RepID=UPI00277E78E2|nr:NAD(P)/FAD-dependent oxidoreductase [Pseudarthrobacter defluvii]MDQ0769078.1 2-polyprenyl-6-methoxyphenol hydroxylase-like FAD-dependent oxidoreductase [Pseudarthrobacter defluvii]
MDAEVIIAGGGPVGLYLAAALLQEGIEVKVLEQRQTRNRHTRAIGVHPPALQALAGVGVAASMVQEGVCIRTGMAVSGGKTVGTMDFDAVSKDFPFVLALPQFRTEQLLEERVSALDPGAVIRGANVTGVTDDGGKVTVDIEPGTGAPHRSATAALLVAADGARSRLRGALQVPVAGTAYPDHYLMGDFDDGTQYGHKAVLFLEPDGIVESFPLPGGTRRWVVRLGQPAGPGAGPAELAELVRRRTGINPDPASNSMLSAFSVRSTIARRTVTGRTVLLGDAAHEISPIGGQGMNLGWLDAAELVPVVCAALAGKPTGSLLREFEKGRKRAAVMARRQAEINMMLGRPLTPRVLGMRTALIGAAAAVPAVNRWVARRFTMH